MNRTRDLSASSAVPQPNAPPRVPLYTLVSVKYRAVIPMLLFFLSWGHWPEIRSLRKHSRTSTVSTDVNDE